MPLSIKVVAPNVLGRDSLPAPHVSQRTRLEFVVEAILSIRLGSWAANRNRHIKSQLDAFITGLRLRSSEHISVRGNWHERPDEELNQHNLGTLLDILAGAEDGAIQQLGRYADRDELPKLQRDYATLIARCSRIECGGCGVPGICAKNDMPDIDRLNTNPKCMAFLRELTAICSAEVCRIYSKYSSWFSGSVSIATVSQASADRFLHGTTTHPNSVAGHEKCALVSLNWPVEEFASDHLLSLVYLVAHELGVHGAQELATVNKPSPASACTFTEGIVDGAIFENFVSGVCATDRYPLLSNFRDELRLALKRAHVERLRGVEGIFRSPTLEAQKAYQDGSAIFERLKEDEALGTDGACTLALSLNLLLGAWHNPIDSSSEREEFVKALDRAFLARSVQMPAEIDPWHRALAILNNCQKQIRLKKRAPKVATLIDEISALAIARPEETWLVPEP